MPSVCRMIRRLGQLGSWLSANNDVREKRQAAETNALATCNIENPRGMNQRARKLCLPELSVLESADTNVRALGQRIEIAPSAIVLLVVL